MHASKEKTAFAMSTVLEMMLSRSYSSKEELMRDYEELCGGNTKAKELYLLVLVELEKAISGDDIWTLIKLSTLIACTSDLESKVTWRACYDNTDNPIRSTNLVILASKYNRMRILQYLLDSDSEILKNLSVGIGRNSISPKDKDEVHHNAFYYAIRSEDIQLLDTLITNKYFNRYFAAHSKELEEILSQTYEELRLKNVPLSDEMQYFVERKLLDQRFFSTGQHPSHNINDNLIKTKKRMELLLQNITLLKVDYLNTRKVDGKFLYIAKFIAKNIHILKGRLRFTYDRIPWEEMEFCLVIFISSQTSVEELNLFYCTILNKEKILNYLEKFANKLTEEDDIIKVDKPNCLPRWQTREKIVNNVIRTCPQFKEFYNDYHQIRDIYSLKRINDYIKLAVSANAEEDQGQFVIIRVLQVIGEHMKNTLESPKLSHTTCDLLIVSLSVSVRKIIIELRDAISHRDTLSKIMKIEETADVSFFVNVQSDIRKVGDVITDILYKNRMKTIIILLNKIVESKSSAEMQEVLERLGSAKLDITIAENFKTLKVQKVEKLVKELSDNIADKTNYENQLFDKINGILRSVEYQTENDCLDYIMGYAHLQTFSVALKYTDEHLMEKIKSDANEVLNSITAKIKSTGLTGIVSLASKICRLVKSRIPRDNFVELLNLIVQINFIVEFETREIKWINELKEKLNETRFKKKIKLPAYQYNNQLDRKIRELSSMLDNNSFSDIKNNEKLQGVVKMFVLDILSILDNPEDYLQNSVLFLDDNTPLVRGKCLRNYLAHGNALIDVLDPDPLRAVLLNAKKLTEEYLTDSTKKISKVVGDDPVKLRQNFDEYLNTLANQERMFVALKEGDLNGLRDCIEKGADIKARSSINSSTTLHFAAEGPSLEVVRFLLDQNLDVNVKNNSGDTPLHIAAAHGKHDIVTFFLKETDISVDVLNIKDQTPLNVAVQNGHKDIVEDLLKNKANIFIQDTRGFPPLYHAILNNRIDIVKILLRKDLNFDIDDTMRGFTALQVATHHGHLELVNFLLESGANIKATTDKNEELLHLAISSGNFEIVNALILRGANVNARNIKDWMPLHCAVLNGNFKIVNTLLTNGANVNFAVADATPLHIAANCGNLKIVVALLEHGADIHTKLNNDGATPLHHAAQSGHKEVVAFLLQQGAQIHSTKINNFTALHEAVRNGHEHVIHLLIKNEARVNAKSTEGITAMHIAANNGSNKEIIDILIRNNGDVNARSRYGWTPLHLAVRENHEAVVDVLIKNKAVVNERSNDGLTPLHVAVMNDNKEIVNLLLENNAQVNFDDVNDSTPLQVAAIAGHKEILEILIAKGANINDNYHSQLSLYYAIKNNHKEIVEFLIEKGISVNEGNIPTWSLPLIAGFPDIVTILLKNNAYVNYKDAQHLTPLHMAAKWGHKKIVKTLIAHRADVNAISANNETPLLCAAQAGFEEVVEIIIAHRSQVNLKSNKDSAPLRAAAKGGHSKVVKVLLANKVNVDVNASVRLAVAGGHLPVVKILLEYTKVDRDAKGEDGFTLLHVASEGTNLELVKYLVDEGFDINATTSNGHKAIHLAASKGNKDTVEYFVGEGSSLNELGAQNKTLLHCAVMGGHLEVVNYLIQHHADVNARDLDNGFTPMHFAAMGGYKEVIQVLLKNGAVYNAVDLCRRPLQLANSTDVIKLLESTDKLFESVEGNSSLTVWNCITAGAFVNAINTNGVRPLHCAARKGYDEVVQVLLQNKANPNVVDNKGLTPLHYAAQFSHLKVAKALLSYYAVYNAVSHDGKTPSDMTQDKSILSLFKLVMESFKNIEDGNLLVIDHLESLKDVDTVKAIMCARNTENKTLVIAAMHSNFSKVQQLQDIAQGDISAQITKAIKLLELKHYQEALRMFTDLFKKRKKILGSDNPATLDIQKYRRWRWRWR